MITARLGPLDFVLHGVTTLAGPWRVPTRPLMETVDGLVSVATEESGYLVLDHRSGAEGHRGIRVEFWRPVTPGEGVRGLVVMADAQEPVERPALGTIEELVLAMATGAHPR